MRVYADTSCQGNLLNSNQGGRREEGRGEGRERIGREEWTDGCCLKTLKLYFLSTFRFTEKLSRKYRVPKYPSSHTPHTSTQSLPYHEHFTPVCAFVIIHEPTSTHHYQPKFIVHDSRFVLYILSLDKPNVIVCIILFFNTIKEFSLP